MGTSIDDRRTQLQLERQTLQARIDQIQRNERQETAGGQTDTAHEWENADVRDDVFASTVQELSQVDAALRRIDQGTYRLCEVCKDAPDATLKANWLPAPDGPFYMLMRLYWPKKEILDGSWKQPVVKKAK